MKLALLYICIFLSILSSAQEIAVLKYKGGGDWYSNPTALPNLVNFSNEHIGTSLATKIAEVDPDSPELFNFPYVYMTGHGNVFFSPEDIENLRLYLKSGGFLHIDDNYGLDQYIRPELKKLFPQKTLKQLPADHPIFNEFYTFENGLPKIHEHDGKPPQAFGIFENERLIILYTYESDLGNGWEDQSIHNDPEAVRLQALQMGANILHYVFIQ